MIMSLHFAIPFFPITEWNNNNNNNNNNARKKKSSLNVSDKKDAITFYFILFIYLFTLWK